MTFILSIITIFSYLGIKFPLDSHNILSHSVDVVIMPAGRRQSRLLVVVNFSASQVALNSKYSTQYSSYVLFRNEKKKNCQPFDSFSTSLWDSFTFKSLLSKQFSHLKKKILNFYFESLPFPYCRIYRLPRNRFPGKLRPWKRKK